MEKPTQVGAAAAAARTGTFTVLSDENETHVVSTGLIQLNMTVLKQYLKGGNKGVGLEVCRQLALQGVTVILTARDEKRGQDAVESLRRESDLSNVIFHQLDVRYDDSVTSLARYIEGRYGKLDILVNNAAVVGVAADEEGLKSLNIDAETWTSGRAANLLKEVFQNTVDEALNCLNTNYYGCKRVTEALLPLLKLSTSGARIVNASSLASELKRMPNEKLRNDLSNIEIWDESE
ncbi:hypothetical protein EJB05_10482 [Eragrostis curvula]|uniref:(+)-neomenthol dehydrogenase-like n=1 Tax=Eragrostis curvula TaxID=38414 RepID=A0A5J9VNK0_9POAL|nr:hypothetical protein EJB05_10482 [Eragrostis curvula]